MPELIPQPTLEVSQTAENEQTQSYYERHKNDLATFAGITATQADLLKLCPVNPSEMTEDAMSRFSAKIAQESGTEIAPEDLHWLEPAPVEKTSAQIEKQLPVHPKTIKEVEKPQIVSTRLVQTKESAVQDAIVVELEQFPQENPAYSFNASELEHVTVKMSEAHKIPPVNEALIQNEEILLAPVTTAINAELVKAHEPEVSSIEKATLITELTLKEDTPRASPLEQVMQMPANELLAQPDTPQPYLEKQDFVDSVLVSQETKNVGKAPVELSSVEQRIVEELLPESPTSAETTHDELEQDQPLVNNTAEYAQPDTHEFNLVDYATVAGEEAVQVDQLEAPITDEILEHLHENIDVSAEQIEQTEVFVATLPETVQESFVEFISRAEPEQVIELEELTLQIAEISDRLHVLAVDGRGETKEAAQIEAVLSVQYETLLKTLGIEVSEEMIKDFIAMVRSDGYDIQMLQATKPEFDPMHEQHGWGDLVNGRNKGGNALKGVIDGLAQFVVKQTADLAL